MTWFAVLKAINLPGKDPKEWFNILNDDSVMNVFISEIKGKIDEPFKGGRNTFRQMADWKGRPKAVTGFLSKQIEENYGKPALEEKKHIREINGWLLNIVIL